MDWLISLVHAGLGWVGLGWVGLGWVGLGWVGLGWVGLGWVGLGWVGLGWVGCTEHKTLSEPTGRECFFFFLNYSTPKGRIELSSNFTVFVSACTVNQTRSFTVIISAISQIGYIFPHFTNRIHLSLQLSAIEVRNIFWWHFN